MESNKQSEQLNSDGSLVGQKRAEEVLNLYFEKFHGGMKPTSDYGYVFGLDTIKKLMEAIEQQNQSGSNKKIHGIRVYHSIDTRPGSAEGSSALIVPVDDKMKDIVKINKFEPKSGEEEEGDVVEPIVVIDPRPCPNLCG